MLKAEEQGPCQPMEPMTTSQPSKDAGADHLLSQLLLIVPLSPLNAHTQGSSSHDKIPKLQDPEPEKTSGSPHKLSTPIVLILPCRIPGFWILSCLMIIHARKERNLTAYSVPHPSHAKCLEVHGVAWAYRRRLPPSTMASTSSPNINTYTHPVFQKRPE